MTDNDQGLIARWLYGGGPQRMGHHSVAAIRQQVTCRRLVAAGISGASIGVVAAVASYWPKPAEHGIPAESVRQCVLVISEIPTEFAARKAYKECLGKMAFRVRHQKWKAFGERVRLRNEQCIRTPENCPPEPLKPE